MLVVIDLRTRDAVLVTKRGRRMPSLEQLVLAQEIALENAEALGEVPLGLWDLVLGRQQVEAN